MLEPENQVSKPWGGADPGPCDKCGQRCRVIFEDGSERECPACKGTGQITDFERRGVSVFRDPDGLYRYMARRDTEMAGSLIVELEGRESDDVDLDADEGALLVFPTRILEVKQLDRARIGELKSKL
jgi:hypothetical protein